MLPKSYGVPLGRIFKGDSALWNKWRKLPGWSQRNSKNWLDYDLALPYWKHACALKADQRRATKAFIDASALLGERDVRVLPDKMRKWCGGHLQGIIGILTLINLKSFTIAVALDLLEFQFQLQLHQNNTKRLITLPFQLFDKNFHYHYIIRVITNFNCW